MRAVLMNEHGDRGVLRLGNLDPPRPGKDAVLIEMTASGLNRLDVFVRQGLTGPGVRSPRTFPHVLGAEGAGIVREVGPTSDTDLTPGDHVMTFSGVSCGRCRYCRRGQISRCADYAILGEDIGGVQRELLLCPPLAFSGYRPG